jgi:hypothetical protein
MAQYFEFESDFVNTMRCIPMQARYKLDAVGIKLGLKEWVRLSADERRELAERPAETAEELKSYRAHLAQLIQSRYGTEAREIPIPDNPAWLNDAVVPEELQRRAAEFGVTITNGQWAALEPLARFALIKLCRPSHENMNFLPALKEFGLV